jgi:lipid-A-disaccharide synthase
LGRFLKLFKAQFFSLPNILAGEALVPELLQHDASGPRMAQEVLDWLADSGRRASLQSRFSVMHSELRCNASDKAAEAVSGLLYSRR